MALKQIPNSHMVWTDCVDCGRYVLAARDQVDDARCTPCWWDKINAQYYAEDE